MDHIFQLYVTYVFHNEMKMFFQEYPNPFLVFIMYNLFSYVNLIIAHSIHSGHFVIPNVIKTFKSLLYNFIYFVSCYYNCRYMFYSTLILMYMYSICRNYVIPLYSAYKKLFNNAKIKVTKNENPKKPYFDE